MEVKVDFNEAKTLKNIKVITSIFLLQHMFMKQSNTLNGD